jgi:ribose/xylose/arabinose/galactoside ABC-type transport system permease subunit
MLQLFTELRVLKEEGRLHTKLLSRVRMLLIISVILATIVVFNIVFRGADLFFAALIAGVGFLLGLFLFSKMNVVSWNEETELVQTDRMNAAGYATLILYICFEIGLRTFLKNSFPATATALVLAGIFGTLFGRVIGTIVEIHKVYRQSHTAK